MAWLQDSSTGAVSEGEFIRRTIFYYHQLVALLVGKKLPLRYC